MTCTHPLEQFDTVSFGMYGQISGKCKSCGLEFTRPLVAFDQGREDEVSEILNLFFGRTQRTPAEDVQDLELDESWVDEHPGDYDANKY